MIVAQGSALLLDPPTPRRPLVWIVIPVWNGREDTLECLASLETQSWTGHQVVVIDNASTDGTAEAVARWSPDTRVIRMEHNAGFVGGTNVGIRMALDAGADLIVLLNNDTVAPVDFIEALVDALDACPDAGLVSPVIGFYEEPDADWFSSGTIDLETGLLLFNDTQRVHERMVSGDAYASEWAPLCATMVRREVFEQVGQLDAAYFGLYDDCDFSVRARGAGWEIVVVPGVRLLHKVSRSYDGAGRPFYTYYVIRNRLFFLDKLVSRRRAMVWAARIGTGQLAGLVRSVVRRDNRRRLHLAGVLGVWDFTLRNMGRCDRRPVTG